MTIHAPPPDARGVRPRGPVGARSQMIDHGRRGLFDGFVVGVGALVDVRGQGIGLNLGGVCRVAWSSGG